MKTKLTLIKRATVLLLLLTLIYQPSTSLAQVTAFTYQGRLDTNGSGANGSYDFAFSLFDLASGGGLLGGPLTTNGCPYPTACSRSRLILEAARSAETRCGWKLA